ncbi:hypothetical protein F5X68DRAFT_265045 [Plectosphaerella plurivora]|uniref:Uncharacterized protein n=1 Tax=Plectosphaerella plurivora TaxID=936078 RepID=A0A9P8V4E8_9PEZI|nr:hypothetical protein F5X68DRAFT_265045 [Plectosphaerella plurivora]
MGQPLLQAVLRVSGTFGLSYASSIALLNSLGFGSIGVAGGSLAAFLQSTIFGAAVPAGSWFATMTSLGMTGGFSLVALGNAGIAAAVIALRELHR